MRKTVKISLGILGAVAIALVGIKFIPANDTTDNKEVKVAEDTTAAIEKEGETEVKTQKEITPEERKKILDEITAKPTETISHPKKEEVKEKKEKPEDMVTVVPVKTTGQPIATSKPSEVKKEDTSKKVNTVVKPEPVKTNPVVKPTEDKKTETKPSKPTETKKSDTKKPSLDDYIDNSPSEYAGDGPTVSTKGGTGDSIDDINKDR